MFYILHFIHLSGVYKVGCITFCVEYNKNTSYSAWCIRNPHSLTLFVGYNFHHGGFLIHHAGKPMFLYDICGTQKSLSWTLAMYTQGFKIKIPLTFHSIFTFGYNVISNVLSQKMKYYQLTICYSVNQKCFQYDLCVWQLIPYFRVLVNSSKTPEYQCTFSKKDKFVGSIYNESLVYCILL